MAADLKLLGNLNLGVIPGAQEGARFLQIRLGERLEPAADTPRRQDVRLSGCRHQGDHQTSRVGLVTDSNSRRQTY